MPGRCAAPEYPLPIPAADLVKASKQLEVTLLGSLHGHCRIGAHEYRTIEVPAKLIAKQEHPVEKENGIGRRMIDPGLNPRVRSMVAYRPTECS
jgi:hypothetical protein